MVLNAIACHGADWIGLCYIMLNDTVLYLVRMRNDFFFCKRCFYSVLYVQEWVLRQGELLRLIRTSRG